MKSHAKSIAFYMLALIFISGVVFTQPIFAQDAAGGGDAAASEAAAAPETADANVETEAAGKKKKGDETFFNIVMNSGVIGIIIWLLIFLTSAATLGLIIDAFITIRQNKIMPPELVEAVRNSLSEGDLGAALEACEATPGPLANILMAGFNNVSEGFEVIMDSVSTAAEIESEKLMQRVNFLNLCGSIAPMLGLMGTVTGMVDAFAGLASATGAEKAQLLALSISQALYTTAFGLLISVPAILAFTFVRNNASKIILTMESLTFDLVKVLRGAEVVDDEDEEEYEDEDDDE
jgi:biopolymer transport protein ExbB